MRVYFLGTNGWIPDEDETSCFMIEHKNKLILLDVGTGASNIKNYVNVLEKYETINIVLSHYHLDHIIGLIYLIPYIKGKTLRIYGPGKPIYDRTTRGILENLLQPDFFSRSLGKFCDDVICKDYSGTDFSIDDIYIKVKEQKHSSASFRITIDNKLIYATDTCFDKADWSEDYLGMVLLHECWEIKSNGLIKHTSLEALINGLPDYLYKSTFLIHKNPEWSKEDYDTIHKLIDNKEIRIAKDGMTIEI